MPNHRSSILSLLHGDKPTYVPAFSGLSTVLAAGLAFEGLDLSDAHGDADKMARLAAATFRLTGLPSAAVPFDLCAEAEALGAVVDFRAGDTFEFPRVITSPFQTADVLRPSPRSGLPDGDIQSLDPISTPPFMTLEVLPEDIQNIDPIPTPPFTTAEVLPGDIRSLNRVPIICEAISQLKREIGGQAVISGVLSGPFTVLSTLVENAALYTEMKRQPGLVLEALSHLSSFIARIGHAYREAGADFLTIHEMGGAPSLLGAKYFEQIVLPSLEELIKSLPAPRVLAVCGNITNVWASLGTTGAEALSIDQSNDLASLRHSLPGTLLFGNLDPVGLLSDGEPAEIRFAAWKAKSDGADAIWPGCDLVPATPPENLRALMK